MGTLYERISHLCDERGITGYRLCKDICIQPSILTDLKSGRKKGLSAEIADKIASYFGVSVGYLLGTEKAKTPPTEDREELLRFALWDGDKGITPAQIDEVKRFAEFVKERDKKNGK